MKNFLKKHADKARFGIVGVANTLLDFAILLVLRSLGVPAVIANYPSSTVAVIFSFFANKNYTFKAKATNLKCEIALFLSFTMFCAWVIQPLVILFVELLLKSFDIQPLNLTIIAKIAATIVTLVWNYLTYSKFVFKKEKV
ncbi:MAG: GtrA family protein [Candidatus Saccharimonadales bacterium]